ncbi:MAG TPA: hypothetical protein PKK23_04440 [Nitrospirales bacterium]|nr:hypothetical protein [Nitrospirales bacterium]
MSGTPYADGPSLSTLARGTFLSLHQIDVSVTGTKGLCREHFAISGLRGFIDDRLGAETGFSPYGRSAHSNQPLETTCQSNLPAKRISQLC